MCEIKGFVIYFHVCGLHLRHQLSGLVYTSVTESRICICVAQLCHLGTINVMHLLHQFYSVTNFVT